jgi:protein SCO1
VGAGGPSMFRTRCAACHTIGGGDGVGPDLLGVTTAHGRDWVARYILAPDKALAAKDPIAMALFKKYNKIKMPNLHLTPVDVKALLDYFDKQTASAAQAGDSSANSTGATQPEPGSTKTSQAPGRN